MLGRRGARQRVCPRGWSRARTRFARLTLAFAAAFLLGAALTRAGEAPGDSPDPQIVTLKAADGTQLKATYFGANQPGPGVLLLHQCNQQRKNWEGLAKELSAIGIHVLTLDYRGYGDSQGTPIPDMESADWKTKFLDKLPSDIDVALEYLESQPGVTRHIMGIGGASCSVNQAIHAAERHSEIKSLVLLSGGADRKGRAFVRGDEKLPVLLVGADDDLNVVPTMQWLFTLCKNPGSRFVRYPTGGHGTDLFAAHKGLEGTIVDWFVRTLQMTPGSAPPTPGERPPTSYPPDVREIIDNGGALRIESKLRNLRRTDPHASLFDEHTVNMLGYEHLQDGDKQGAIDILKLNAYAYPDSANVYDSLGDAYFMAGDKDLAKKYSLQALKMIEADTSAPESWRKMVINSANKKLQELGVQPPKH
jgi:dienelactone hydrolase